MKTLSLEELVKINDLINRRLRLANKKEFILLDSNGEEINAKQIGFPQIVCAARFNNPDNRELFRDWHERPYEMHSVGPFSRNFLTLGEMNIVLGKDHYFECTLQDANAMLQAATSGPSIANAYLLGGIYNGVHENHRYSVVPIQYYKISKTDHKRLGIKAEKKLLELYKNQLKEERARQEKGN